MLIRQYLVPILFLSWFLHQKTPAKKVRQPFFSGFHLPIQI